MKWFLKVLKQYADFSGRASRQEYWMYCLFYVLFGYLAVFIDMFIWYLTKTPSPLFFLYFLGLLVPTLAVWARRLHDVGKSAWLILVGLIPFIGFIWLMVLSCLEGTPGINQYGPDPKASTSN